MLALISLTVVDQSMLFFQNFHALQSHVNSPFNIVPGSTHTYTVAPIQTEPTPTTTKKKSAFVPHLARIPKGQKMVSLGIEPRTFPEHLLEAIVNGKS